MKKLMTMLLGLSLAIGAVTAFAADTKKPAAKKSTVTKKPAAKKTAAKKTTK
jgi:hypothetical protein